MAGWALLARHDRISVVERRHERFLDDPRSHPARQIQLRSGLVVRARGARSAERLLSEGPHTPKREWTPITQEEIDRYLDANLEISR